MDQKIRLIDGKDIPISKYRHAVIELLFQTGEELYTYQFISKEIIDLVIGKSLELKGSLFSADEATVALNGNDLVGIEIGFTGTCFRKRQITMKPIWDNVGKNDLKLIIKRSRQCRYLTPSIESNSYYVLGLSVKKEWQGKGVGKLLMNNAMERARNLGLKQIQLDVMSNYHAVSFYQALGFQCLVASTSPLPKENGVPTMFRMSSHI